jgi:signal transduction histidine kinase
VTLIGAWVAWPAFLIEHMIVLLVVICAVAGGRGPALGAAAAGGLADNLMLREPIEWSPITSARGAVDVSLFLAVAFIVGWLVEGLRIARAHAAEGAERERRAREERNRLVATITHDLATPLGVIHGTLRVLRTNGPHAVDTAKLLSRVETAAGRATSLLRTLADTQSLQEQSLALALRPVDLRSIVERTAAMLDEVSDRHPIVLTMDGTPLVVNADAERVGRVLENLITNAIKYSPHGGSVEIAVRESAGWAEVTVRDYGIGLSPGAAARIFDVGYRAPEAENVAPGLGLGLYIAAEVVRRHGGVITADPLPSTGAMFTVRLPLTQRRSLILLRDCACDPSPGRATVH